MRLKSGIDKLHSFAPAMAFLKVHRSIIIFSFVISFVARLLFFFAEAPWEAETEQKVILVYDGLGYNTLAHALLEKGSYRTADKDGDQRVSISQAWKDKLSEYGDDFLWSVETMRPPGYPFFIAVIYALFGTKLWMVLLVQIALDSLTCCIIAVACKGLVAPSGAKIAATIYALSPFAIRWSALLYSEVILIFILSFFLAIAFWSAWREHRDWRTPRIALMGLLIGIAAWVKPIALYLSIVIGIWFLFLPGKSIRLRIVHAALIIALSFLVVLPWIARNFYKFEELSLSTASSYNALVLYQAPGVMLQNNLSFEDAETLLYLQADSLMVSHGETISRLNDFQKAKYWRQLAWERFKRDPEIVLQTYLYGLLRSLLTLESHGTARILRLPTKKVDLQVSLNPVHSIKRFLVEKTLYEYFFAAYSLAYYILLYSMVGVGLVRSWKGRNCPQLSLCLLVALYFLLITAPAGQPRLILPGLPFILPFAAIGAEWILSRLSRQKMKSTLVSTD